MPLLDSQDRIRRETSCLCAQITYSFLCLSQYHYQYLSQQSVNLIPIGNRERRESTLTLNSNTSLYSALALEKQTFYALSKSSTDRPQTPSQSSQFVPFRSEPLLSRPQRAPQQGQTQHEHIQLLKKQNQHQKKTKKHQKPSLLYQKCSSNLNLFYIDAIYAIFIQLQRLGLFLMSL